MFMIAGTPLDPVPESTAEPITLLLPVGHVEAKKVGADIRCCDGWRGQGQKSILEFIAGGVEGLKVGRHAG